MRTSFSFLDWIPDPQAIVYGFASSSPPLPLFWWRKNIISSSHNRCKEHSFKEGRTFSIKCFCHSLYFNMKWFFLMWLIQVWKFRSETKAYLVSKDDCVINRAVSLRKWWKKFLVCVCVCVCVCVYVCVCLNTLLRYNWHVKSWIYLMHIPRWI